SPDSRPSRTRFSSADRCASTAADCPVTAKRRFASAGSVCTSTPITCTDPASARLKVVRMLMHVVFPAPLAPSSANTSPLLTWRSHPSRTVLDPNALDTPVKATAGGSARSPGCELGVRPSDVIPSVVMEVPLSRVLCRRTNLCMGETVYETNTQYMTYTI